jgi:zinc transport system substrate-binding protein
MKIISVKVPLLRMLSGVATVVALLLAAACGQPGSAAEDAATPGRLSIVTAFYPFQFIAQRVAGEHASVTSLTAPGAEPHDLELTPKQVASVTTADLVIYEKSFQAAVDEAVAQSENPNVLDTATVVPLVPLTPGADDHDHVTTADGADHETSGLDPHVWLDPNNMIRITDAVAERLAAIDPPHAADYRAGAKALDADLTKLDTSYRTGLANCERREFITTHAAFGYLARAYDLTQIGINGLSPDSEPSPARIAAVQQIARDRQITTIFYETLVSPAIAQSIAGDLGLKTDVLDPIEGITDSSRGTDYLSVMTSNLTALRTANGCR